MSSNSASTSPEQAQVAVPTNKHELMAAIDDGTLAAIMEKMQNDEWRGEKGWQVLRTEKSLREGLNGSNAVGHQVGLRREIREFLGLAPAQVGNQAAERAEEVAGLEQLKAEFGARVAARQNDKNPTRHIESTDPKVAEFLSALTRAVRLLHEAETKANETSSGVEAPAEVAAETAAAAHAVVEAPASSGELIPSREALMKTVMEGRLPQLLAGMRKQNWQVTRDEATLRQGLGDENPRNVWERHGLRNELHRLYGLPGIQFDQRNQINDATRAEEVVGFKALEKEIRDQMEYLEADQGKAADEFLAGIRLAMTVLHTAEKPVTAPVAPAPAEPAPAAPVAPAPAEPAPAAPVVPAPAEPAPAAPVAPAPAEPAPAAPVVPAPAEPESKSINDFKYSKAAKVPEKADKLGNAPEKKETAVEGIDEVAVQLAETSLEKAEAAVQSAEIAFNGIDDSHTKAGFNILNLGDVLRQAVQDLDAKKTVANEASAEAQRLAPGRIGRLRDRAAAFRGLGWLRTPGSRAAERAAVAEQEAQAAQAHLDKIKLYLKEAQNTLASIGALRRLAETALTSAQEAQAAAQEMLDHSNGKKAKPILTAIIVEEEDTNPEIKIGAPAETFPESIQKIVTEAKGGALKARVDEMKREGHTWQVMRNKETLDRDLVNVGNRQGLQRELNDLIGPVDAATDFTAAQNFRNKALPALQRALKGQEAQPEVEELLKALDVATRALVDAETAATTAPAGTPSDSDANR